MVAAGWEAALEEVLVVGRPLDNGACDNVSLLRHHIDPYIVQRL